MKILHLADIHCRDKNLEEIKKCLHAVLERAWEEKPDLVVVAGDVFHSRSVHVDSESARSIFKFFSRLSEVSPVAVVLGTPSHDGEAAIVLGNLRAGHNIFVANKPVQIFLHRGVFTTYETPKDGGTTAIISFVPPPTKQFWPVAGDITETDKGISATMSGIFAGFGVQAEGYDCPHILVGHFSVRGAAISSGQVMIGREIEIGKDQIALANADIVCLGHIHKSQFIQPNIYYSGSIYRLDYGETEAKGFMIHELWGVRPRYKRESHFVEVPARRLVKIDYDLVGNTDIEVEDLNQALIHAGKISDIKDAYIKIDLKINQDEASKLDISAIEKRMLNAGAKSVDIKLIRVPRENVRSAEILRMTSLRDKVSERARLAGETVPESILCKADRLESEDPGEIIGGVSRIKQNGA